MGGWLLLHQDRKFKQGISSSPIKTSQFQNSVFRVKFALENSHLYLYLPGIVLVCHSFLLLLLLQLSDCHQQTLLFFLRLAKIEKVIDRPTQTPLCGFTFATQKPLLKLRSDEYVFELLLYDIIGGVL